jgi:AmmeMemoRadiSam system protein B/AmmeMemoRadiSam system protein A
MKGDRVPAVAGKFYPVDSEKLKREVEHFALSAIPKKYERVRAVISPHAGYVFSGGVSASAFNQLESTYKRVFIIGSSHQVSFNGASVFCEGDFLMPYGKEVVDRSTGKLLTEQHPELFTSDPSPHLYEHSLEVQLPFLNNALKADYQIIPVIIGTSRPETCKALAAALKPWFTIENLFVISTDFSHYPDYHDANYVDGVTKDAILDNDPQTLLATLKRLKDEHISHLATSLCGWTSVLTLLYITSEDKSVEYNAVEYKNSGDARYYGDKERVVGYWAIAVCEKRISENSEFLLSEKDKSSLLAIARETVKSAALYGSKGKLAVEPSDLSPALKTNCGAFVTLHKRGRLRGCIGHLTGDMPLYRMVQEMALASALHDYRFPTIREEELIDIEVEISVLSPLKKIGSPGEIVLGKHGIYIVKGRKSGVFLPQVATETGWSKEEFLGHCSRDKAGLEWDGWKDAQIYIFTVLVVR